jgi:hypothetical protein
VLPILQSDNEFVEILAEVRSGSAAAKVIARLQKMCSQPVTLDGIIATKVNAQKSPTCLFKGAPQKISSLEISNFRDATNLNSAFRSARLANHIFV